MRVLAVSARVARLVEEVAVGHGVGKRAEVDHRVLVAGFGGRVADSDVDRQRNEPVAGQRAQP